MLIEPKNTNPGDVITMKLIGGDEVVGRLVEDNGFQIIIKKPLVVAMAQQGFGLMPFALTLNPDHTLSISQSHIICFGRTIDDVSKHYIQQTTGLVT